MQRDVFEFAEMAETRPIEGGETAHVLPAEYDLIRNVDFGVQEGETTDIPDCIIWNIDGADVTTAMPGGGDGGFEIIL